MLDTSDWQQIYAFLGVVAILFTAGAYVQSLWLRARLSELQSDIITHVTDNYMNKREVQHRLDGLDQAISRLQSPPMLDKLEALRLTLFLMVDALEDKGAIGRDAAKDMRQALREKWA